ncbi:MAG: F0F1 ATP synthase subunit A [Nitrospinae bacterium]|nr:F0F1 ATP synthase subunit A [Nitrospinota bacterium]
MENPLHHFELHPLVHLTLLGFDISINKAILAMWAGLAAVFILFMIVVRGGLSLVPGKIQSLGEISVDFIRDMVNEYIGADGMKFFPFIATLFFFILACNLVGLIPGSYTLTSQLAVTGAFAGAIFILTLIVGFARHGLHFLSILVPPGIPKVLIPLMVPIEIISQLARPISLSVRLFANMTAGHTVLGVLFALATATALWIGWMPFGFTILINGLEMFIAFIQAYIFTTLTCVYIGDVIKLH